MKIFCALPFIVLFLSCNKTSDSTQTTDSTINNSNTNADSKDIFITSRFVDLPELPTNHTIANILFPNSEETSMSAAFPKAIKLTSDEINQLKSTGIFPQKEISNAFALSKWKEFILMGYQLNEITSDNYLVSIVLVSSSNPHNSFEVYAIDKENLSSKETKFISLDGKQSLQTKYIEDSPSGTYSTIKFINLDKNNFMVVDSSKNKTSSSDQIMFGKATKETNEIFINRIATEEGISEDFDNGPIINNNNIIAASGESVIILYPAEDKSLFFKKIITLSNTGHSTITQAIFFLNADNDPEKELGILYIQRLNGRNENGEPETSENYYTEFFDPSNSFSKIEIEGDFEGQKTFAEVKKKLTALGFTQK